MMSIPRIVSFWDHCFQNPLAEWLEDRSRYILESLNSNVVETSLRKTKETALEWMPPRLTFDEYLTFNYVAEYYRGAQAADTFQVSLPAANGIPCLIHRL
eukprot:GHVU01093969.1.p2 GENE.GHVU01093969.1~~GHVU01093969.1.p2  ORF type:complete len:100 (+),score=6.56 GHVU01093969.1:368-667(+)